MWVLDKGKERDMANSPKADKFDKLAAETRAKAEQLPEDDPVREYLERSANRWEREAKGLRQKAERRAHAMKPEVRHARLVIDARIHELKKQEKQAKQAKTEAK